VLPTKQRYQRYKAWLHNTTASKSGEEPRPPPRPAPRPAPLPTTSPPSDHAGVAQRERAPQQPSQAQPGLHLGPAAEQQQPESGPPTAPEDKSQEPPASDSTAASSTTAPEGITLSNNQARVMKYPTDGATFSNNQARVCKYPTEGATFDNNNRRRQKAPAEPTADNNARRLQKKLQKQLADGVTPQKTVPVEGRQVYVETRKVRPNPDAEAQRVWWGSCGTDPKKGTTIHACDRIIRDTPLPSMSEGPSQNSAHLPPQQKNKGGEQEPE